MGGRGAGKTFAGSAFVVSEVRSGRARRVALVGETLHDARAVMIEGASGVLAACARWRPRFEPSKRRIVWRNGAVAEFFSGDDPESLRGPQFDLAWCDEFAKWREPQAAFDMLQMALRLGARPRAMVTTTPRNIGPLKRLIAAPDTIVTRAGTAANAANLAPDFLARMALRYGGSALGRQELDGEIVEDDAGALWRRAWIDAARAREAPELERVVVAVDPPAGAGEGADACGVIVAGRAGGEAFVLADRTTQGLSPMGWAGAAARAFDEFEADAIVVEVNQGGELAKQALAQARPGAPVRAVRASRGKAARAEPVALLYERGRVRHVGSLAALEDEMCAFDGARSAGRSPDRVDALVWALTHLMLDGEAGAPRLRRL